MSVRTTGQFSYAKWQESVVSPDGASPVLAHASVLNTFSGGVEAADTTCEYTIVYTTEQTGTFTGMELVSGCLDGREGSFVLEERGSFDADFTVRCAFEVVPGSGTGALIGLRGKGEFTSRKGEPSIPYTFSYELD